MSKQINSTSFIGNSPPRWPGRGHPSSSGASYGTDSARDLLAEIDLVRCRVDQLVIHTAPASFDPRHRVTDHQSSGRLDDVHRTIQRLEKARYFRLVRIANRETPVEALLAQELNREFGRRRGLILQHVSRDFGEAG